MGTCLGAGCRPRVFWDDVPGDSPGQRFGMCAHCKSRQRLVKHRGQWLIARHDFDRVAAEG